MPPNIEKREKMVKLATDNAFILTQENIMDTKAVAIAKTKEKNEKEKSTPINSVVIIPIKLPIAENAIAFAKVLPSLC